jgi:DNA-binding transcriptional ArsR family regulator
MAARPVTRRNPDTGLRRTHDLGAGPARPQVRDLTGGVASFRIDWDVRTAFDFLFSLSGDAGSTDDLPAAERAWLTKAKAGLSPETRQTVTELFESELGIHGAEDIVERTEVRTSGDVVEALATVEPRALIREMVTDPIKEPEATPVVDRALEGDSAAFEELRPLLHDWRVDERLAILRDPDGTYDRLMGALREWGGAFGDIEARVGSILERDYDLRAGDRATLSGSDLIEQTTGGIRWLPEGGVRRVILAPSYFSRPYNYLMSGGDWRFFGYPVADAALDPADPLAAPQSVVRLHRALGDETRLKILKLLAGRDLYLTEIAQQLELSKPTIKHHLAILRSAGLVTITESGTVMYYSLRRGRLDDASLDIKSFLIG